MANEPQLKQLIKEGLLAMKTGSEKAAKATDVINNAARNPKLKEALKKGNEASKKWVERIDYAIAEAGSADRLKTQSHYGGANPVTAFYILRYLHAFRCSFRLVIVIDYN